MTKTPVNPALNLIFNRKSCRNFTGVSISPEILETIIKAGMAAPSAMNLQPWDFILVSQKEILSRLADGLPHGKMLYDAAAAIVVCGKPDTENNVLPDYWVQDCSAATENILLAVEAVGLGAVWTGVFPRNERITLVKELLKIPEPILPLNVIAIGHPAKETSPKDKYKPDKIHYECW